MTWTALSARSSSKIKPTALQPQGGFLLVQKGFPVGLRPQAVKNSCRGEHCSPVPVCL